MASADLGPTKESPSYQSVLPCCRLYRLIQNVEAYLPCALAGAGEWAPPVGWELIAMLHITEPGGQVAPFAAVTLNEEASQLVVALRGTMLPGEWALDFSYK